ncbi:hypothetical protein GGH94_003744 [Coemansia aciculifera]|uniref:Velvet domain-containing protein n=1 Tax=Coemansia aciculifera TaxID=417176 RepID=A0A9W8IJH6_9FUNG|nr:hypothetical protein GGH94_003744 [Coemansia aciculifera]KAJ2871078.1 hypothetical protein GGH93_005095 [Coemansia aciculifera]
MDREELVTSSPTSSYTTSSDHDRHIARYHGSVDAPAHGIVDETLDPVTVTLERLDAYGTPLRVTEAFAHLIVVHVILASEDGTIDYDVTETGEVLLYGEIVQTPKVLEGKLVVSFKSLVARRPGVFRFRIRMFDIRDVSLDSLSPECSTAHPLPSDALYTDSSPRIIIRRAEVLPFVQR